MVAIANTVLSEVAKELWRHKPTRDLYTVTTENGEIILSMGPFNPADATTVDLVHGEYLSKVAELAAETHEMQRQREWISANRDEFEVIER